MLKKGTPASPATAFASNVLPVPGGPSKSTPLGILAPTLIYLPGSFRKSTISSSSSFSSFSPATCSKVMFLSPMDSLARLLPKFIILPLPPAAFWALIIMNRKMPTASTISMGTKVVSTHPSLGTSFTTGSNPWSLTRASASPMSVTYSLRSAPLLSSTARYPVGTSLLGLTTTSETLSASMSAMNCSFVYASSEPFMDVSSATPIRSRMMNMKYELNPLLFCLNLQASCSSAYPYASSNSTIPM